MIFLMLLAFYYVLFPALSVATGFKDIFLLTQVNDSRHLNIKKISVELIQSTKELKVIVESDRVRFWLNKKKNDVPNI